MRLVIAAALFLAMSSRPARSADVTGWWYVRDEVTASSVPSFVNLRPRCGRRRRAQWLAAGSPGRATRSITSAASRTSAPALPAATAPSTSDQRSG